jgi:hypothetical protein
VEQAGLGAAYVAGAAMNPAMRGWTGRSCWRAGAILPGGWACRCGCSTGRA